MGIKEDEMEQHIREQLCAVLIRTKITICIEDFECVVSECKRVLGMYPQNKPKYLTRFDAQILLNRHLTNTNQQNNK